MRPFLLLFAFLFVGALAANAQLARKGTQQAFSTEGVNTIRFNIDPNQVEVRTTRGTRVLVEINVAINGTMPLLDYAIGTGRYNMTAVTEGSTLTISPNDRNQAIIIRGETIREELTYTIYMPEHLERNSTVATSTVE